MSDIKNFILTHKTWTVLWIAVAIFWLVGFGISCGKLSHSTLYKGRPFYAELFGSQPPRDDKKHHDDDDVYEEIQNRNFPGWMVCAGLPDEPSVTSSVEASCSQCIFTVNSSDLNCADKIDVPGSFDSNFTKCYIFNGPYPIVTVPTPMPNRSIVNCDFTLVNTTRARFYVFDQGWFSKRESRWLLPDGIVQRTLPIGTRNLVELTRSKYIFTKGSKEKDSFYSYDMLDGESYQRNKKGVPEDDVISLTLFYGSPSEWRYTQYPFPRVTTGFDFYSWISFLGGLTFFCYFTQVGLYALICKVMGWENDTNGENYQTMN